MSGFLNTPVGSFLKVFASVVLTAFVADLVGVTSFGDVFSGWQAWVIAGLVSAVPVLINWLNPADTRYGKGA
jgi:hypothetical protein